MSAVEDNSSGSQSNAAPSSSDQNDHSFLFCTLAIALEYLTSEQVEEIVGVWSRDSELSISLYCEQENYLTKAQCDVLNATVAQMVDKDQVEPSLGGTPAVADEDVRALLDDLKGNDMNLAGLLGLGDDTESVFAEHALEPDDRFEVIETLAKGGLGEVFRANDRQLHRSVAVKKIQNWHSDSTESCERFILEAEVTGRLEHPGIVPVYGMGLDTDNRPFYAMRLVQGRSLKEELHEFYSVNDEDVSKRTVAFRKLLTRFVDVCEAVAYAHSRSVLHRDIKPSNIILGKYGETLVVDWGLAKVLDGTEDKFSTEERFVPTSGSSVNMTVIGRVVGTPGYMSPEQAAGQLETLDERTDVYSLGATLYTLLTGKTPFENTPDILEMVKDGDFESPSVLNPSLSKPLVAICEKAMSTRIKDRYESPRDLAHDIELWLADEPVSAYTERTVEKLSRTYRRNRNVFFLTISFTLLAFVASIGVAAKLASQRNVATKNFETANDLAFRLLNIGERELIHIPGHAKLRTKMAAEVNDAMKEFCDADPSNVDAQISYAQSLRFLAGVLTKTGKREEAAKYFAESIELLGEVCKRRSVDKALAFTHAANLMRFGRFLSQEGDIFRSRELFESAIEIATQLNIKEPAEQRTQRLLAKSQLELAVSYWDEGDGATAITQLATAEATGRDLYENSGRNKDALIILDCIRIKSEYAKERGDLDQAILYAEEAVELAASERGNGVASSTTHFWLNCLLRYHENRLIKDPEDGVAIEALQLVEKNARAVIAECGTESVDYPIMDFDLARCLMLEAKYDEKDKSLEHINESIDLFQKMVASSGIVKFRSGLVKALSVRAMLPEVNKKAAIEDLTIAAELQDEICQTIPSDTREKKKLAELREQLFRANVNNE